MSLVSELEMLTRSDLSGAAIDQLVSHRSLFVRNTIIHFLGACVGWFLHVHIGDRRGWLTVGFTVDQWLRSILFIYLGLQVIHLWSGIFAIVLADSIFDVLVVVAGASLSYWVAMQDPRRDRK